MFGAATGVVVALLHAPRESKAKAIATDFKRHLHQW
jgi:hypothetical protein